MQTIYRILFISVLSILTVISSYCQTATRQIAVLDLQEENDESNDSRLFSTTHMLEIAGVPYTVQANLLNSLSYAIIVTTSQLKANTFTDQEKDTLRHYVENGGIIVVPKILDPDLFDLFGIDSITESNLNHEISFQVEKQPTLFKYIDEPEERTISLGRESKGEIFKTSSYFCNDCTTLATYKSGMTALIKNDYGMGSVFAFGVSWKEVIVRSQINRDYEAQRISSNGFEPTQDVFCLFMRQLYNMYIPYGVWKHTSVGNSTSTLMITHDIDSGTAMDSLVQFCNSEKNMEIQSTYNVTVRYIADVLMTDFYTNAAKAVPEILNYGHIIGSHSVGHFFDFGDDDIFPLGEIGQTKDDYKPYNDGNITTGGNVFGECGVSKKVLEDDFGQEVVTFRSGHLVYNKYLVNILDSLGYLYNSSFSANSVLTNFPYRCRYNRSFSGDLSNIYEFGVSISDVFHSNPISSSNFLLKADIWNDVTRKIDANYAPTVLLIHPNRGYKLIGQEYYLQHLPKTMAVMEMGNFGDYWRAREALSVHSFYNGDSLLIQLDYEDVLKEEISLIVENGQDIATINTVNMDGMPLSFLSEKWGDNDLILFRSSSIFSPVLDFNKTNHIKLYPNPANRHINVELDLDRAANIVFELYDLTGAIMYTSREETRSAGDKFIHLDFSHLSLYEGIYLLKIDAGINGSSVHKIFVKNM